MAALLMRVFMSVEESIIVKQHGRGITALAAGAAAIAALAWLAAPRIALSRAKHPSLAGHSKMSRRVAGAIPSYAYDEVQFFRCDGAPDAVAEQRRAGFMTLSDLFRTRFAKTTALTS